MGTPGAFVVLSDGSFALAADGSFLVFDAAGNCPECCGGGGHCVTGCGCCSCAGGGYPNVLATADGIILPGCVTVGPTSYTWVTPPDLSPIVMAVASGGLTCQWSYGPESQNSELHRFATPDCSGDPTAVFLFTSILWSYYLDCPPEGMDAGVGVSLSGTGSFHGSAPISWTELLFSNLEGPPPARSLCPPQSIANQLVSSLASAFKFGGTIFVEGHP